MIGLSYILICFTHSFNNNNFFCRDPKSTGGTLSNYESLLNGVAKTALFYLHGNLNEEEEEEEEKEEEEEEEGGGEVWRRR